MKNCNSVTGEAGADSNKDSDTQGEVRPPALPEFFYTMIYT
jgi:hypothetical protein